MIHHRRKYAAPRRRWMLALMIAWCGSVPGALARAESTGTDFLRDVLSQLEIPMELGDNDGLPARRIKRTSRQVFDAPEFRTLPHLNLDEGAASRSNDERQQFRTEDSSSGKPASRSGSSGGFADWLRGLVGGAAEALLVLLAVLIVAGLIAAIAFVVRTWRGQESSPANSDDAVDDDADENNAFPGDRPADAWLAAAQAAAVAGDFEKAVSLLLFGAMGHAERSGFIRPRRGLTYRDYLRVVPRGSAWHPALARLVRAYAPIGFGRRNATAEIYDAVRDPYERALAAEPGAPRPEASR